MADNNTKAQIHRKIQKLNPALKHLEVLIGDWDIEMSAASFLSIPSATLNASAS